MGVDLGKGAGREEPVRPDGSTAVARTAPPPEPYRPREADPAPAPQDGPQYWHDLPMPAVRFISAAWPALWICMFAFGPWQVGLVMLLLTGPIMGALHGKGDGRRRRRHEVHGRQRRRREELQAAPVAALPATSATADAETAPSVSRAERSLASTVVRVETSGGRIDRESVELVREVDVLLRPLLVHLRTRQADPRVRHDLEQIAVEHLPRTVEDYLVLPDDYARTHRTRVGTTPADELRTQLQLLVEGCRQLRDAVHDADVDRQQQQSRFLEAKFRRSDLDL